jgi:hypothetical protein
MSELRTCFPFLEMTSGNAALDSGKSGAILEVSRISGSSSSKLVGGR